MQAGSQHIIHKLTLEVNTSSVQQGYEIKDNVRSFIDAHIVPAIEQYFSGLTTSMSADEVVQLDKLELTINSGQTGWNITGLGQAIQVEFDKAISVTLSDLAASSAKRKTVTSEPDSNFGNALTSSVDAPKVENLKVFTKSKHGVLAWISFLNDGTTDWFTNEMLKSGSGAQEEQLLKSIFQEVEALNKKRGIVFGTADARKRLIGQFSDNFLISLVTVVSRNSLSVNYSSVLPKQKQSIDLLIGELLRGIDSQTRTRFWEVVFGMLNLNTSQSILSEEAFLLELERFFPKAPQLLNTAKNAQKKSDPVKSSGKKTVQANSESISYSSTGKSSLILDDVSVIGIRLLEWIHALQSKQVSLKKYITLQTSMLEKKRNLSDSLTLNASTTAKNTSPSDLIKPLQEDVIKASQTENSPINKQSDPETNTTGESEPELNVKNRQFKNSDELLDSEESIVNEKNQTHHQGSEFQITEDPVVLSEQAADSVLESDEKTIDSHNQQSSPKESKSSNSAEDMGAQAKTKLFKEEGTHLLVESAGLVILHPFLKHFFTGIGLLNEENKLTDKVLAAHVLHFVATGREHDFEQLMSFEKYLVGIDPFESIPREITISDAIKQEAENLLKAVRENWKPLQSSSSAALRETFIQRPGKLINESPNPRLVVERKTVDVLMAQLNWTISIIRLPWLDELIFVEW